MSRRGFFIILFLVVAGCDNGVGPVPTDSRILPLSVGNSWNYAVTWARLDSIAPADSVTMRVRALDTVMSFIGYQVENLIVGPFTMNEMMLAGRPDGLYIGEWGHTVPPQEPVVRRILPYPTRQGDTVRYASYTIETESVHTPVTVPAGSFQCIKYVARIDTSVVGLIWIEPDVGIVRAWSQYGLVEYTHLLTSYSLR